MPIFVGKVLRICYSQTLSGELFNPLSIDPNERVTPQHRLSIAQSVAGLSIDHCGTSGRVTSHFDNCTPGAYVVSPPIGNDDNSRIAEEINIITLSDVGLIPPPPMFGGPPKTLVGVEGVEEVEAAHMVKPMFEDATAVSSAGLDDNMDDEDDCSSEENEDGAGFGNEYAMQQASVSVDCASVINSQQGAVAGVNTRIIQV